MTAQILLVSVNLGLRAPLAQFSSQRLPPFAQALDLLPLCIKITLIQPRLEALFDNRPFLIRDTEPGRISPSTLDNHVFSIKKNLHQR